MFFRPSDNGYYHSGCPLREHHDTEDTQAKNAEHQQDRRRLSHAVTVKREEPQYARLLVLAHGEERLLIFNCLLELMFTVGRHFASERWGIRRGVETIDLFGLAQLDRLDGLRCRTLFTDH